MISNKTINALIKYFEAKESKTEEENSFIEELSLYADAFPITAVTRDDLEATGFNVSNVTDEQMDKLAREMSDDYCNQLFWESMEIIAEDFIGIKRKEEDEVPTVKVQVEWDTDGIDADVPEIVEIPTDLNEDEVSDWISNKYGWYVVSWCYQN